MAEATARAKVNLFLHIIGRQDDGLHLLESLVMFADFGDTISVTSAPELEITVDGAHASAVPQDGGIVRQAAEALSGKSGEAPRAAIHLTKRIPVGGGLGGGSSDAALAGKLLNTLSDNPLDDLELFARLVPLGADMPVCLCNQSSFVSGTGDRITALPAFPSLNAVLIGPGPSLATADVFDRFSATGSASRSSVELSDLERIESAEDLFVLLSESSNDLTGAAISLVPAIGDVIEALRALPDCRLARMSGSGATCFGLFESQAAADAALQAIQQRMPKCWGVAVKLGG